MTATSEMPTDPGERAMEHVYDSRPLEGAVALISGAGSGMGRAASLMIASAGGRVVALDVANAQRTASEVTERGGEAVAVTGDVRDADAWAAAVGAGSEAFGAITVLANVAGVSRHPDTVTDVDPEHWREMLDIDLGGVFQGMRAVVPQMRANGGGRIVNVASLAGLRGMAGLAGYSAAKGGVLALTRQAAIEHAVNGIRVNAIAPGVIDTPLLVKGFYEPLVAATPVGRLGTVDEIAAAIVYLASPLADFITGTTLVIDGGWGTRA